MNALSALWARLPVIVRAVLAGTVVAVAGALPWGLLVSLNSRHLPALPWAVPPAALYLWLFWRFVRGRGWPRAGAATRRELCRANPLPLEVWAMSLLAGTFGLATVVLLQRVIVRLVVLPQQQDAALRHAPPVSLAVWVV